jgi:hypothetical protein
MDWAAKYFFDMWMPNLDAALDPAARDHEGPFDEFLMDPARAGGPARRRGRRAGSIVAVWLQNDRKMTRTEAKARLADLAIELNHSEDSLDKKDALVVKLLGVWQTDLENRMRAVVDRQAPAASLL